MQFTGYYGKSLLYAKNHHVTEWEVKKNLMIYTEKHTTKAFTVTIDLDTMKEIRKEITK